MENNIEDLIRDDFEKREIKPSNDAFEFIHERIHNYRRKRRIRIVKTITYAASITGIVLMLQFLFQPQKQNDHMDVITNTVANDSTELQLPNDKNNFFIVTEEVDTTMPSSIEYRNNMKLQKEKFVKHDVKLVSNNTSQKRDSNLVEDLKPPELNDSIYIVTNTISDTLRKTYKLEEVTDAELDALLASAHQSLDKVDRNSLSVDAQKMLYELEVEINKPLPEKILFTVRTGVVTVKEIVKSNTKENK